MALPLQTGGLFQGWLGWEPKGSKASGQSQACLTGRLEKAAAPLRVLRCGLRGVVGSPVLRSEVRTSFRGVLPAAGG